MSTFSQLYIQIVFAVCGREWLIHPSWEDELYKYITGIVQNKEQKMLIINGMPDHIHMVIGMTPTCILSDLVREIKKSSNAFINERKLAKGKFAWQQGFGAFSYSKEALDRVINYVRNQKQHHRTCNFRKEYDELLAENNITPIKKYYEAWFQECGLPEYSSPSTK